MWQGTGESPRLTARGSHFLLPRPHAPTSVPKHVRGFLLRHDVAVSGYFSSVDADERSKMVQEAVSNMHSTAAFAAMLIVALSVAFIGWAVVRLTSQGEK